MQTKIFQKNIANILGENNFSVANTDPGMGNREIFCVLQTSIS